MSKNDLELERRRRAEAEEAEAERRAREEQYDRESYRRASMSEIDNEVRAAWRREQEQDAEWDRLAEVDYQRYLDQATEEWKDEVAEPAKPEQEREEERRVPDAAVRPYVVRDVEMDPGWLNRWEAEGVMTPLSDEEREKLKMIDREDPIGREGRAQFLPREVLAIRANSERAVEKMRAEREAKAEAQVEKVQEEPAREEKAPVQEPERQAQDERKSAARVAEQEQDDDMEMDR